MRRGATGGGARGRGSGGSEDVVARYMLVRGHRRRWRCVGVVRAGVGAEAGHGQGGAVRGRAHGRFTRRRARQWGRVVEWARRRLAPHACATSIRLRRGLRWKLCMCIVFYSDCNHLGIQT